MAWEFLLILLLINVEFWFNRPFSLMQIISWLLLITSIFLVLDAVYLLRKTGNHGDQYADPTLLEFEKTTALVTSGIYHYIRHPMYASLLYLTWGIYLKELSWLSTILTVIITLLLIRTTQMEEKENLDFFGSSYRNYMSRTKRFIPYLF